MHGSCKQRGGFESYSMGLMRQAEKIPNYVIKVGGDFGGGPHQFSAWGIYTLALVR